MLLHTRSVCAARTHTYIYYHIAKQIINYNLRSVKHIDSNKQNAKRWIYIHCILYNVTYTMHKASYVLYLF